MAGGMFSSIKIEIQFTPGQWTDVSADVALENGVKITFGRSDEFSDNSPAQLEFVLRNDTGKYTPSNPTSVYFPYVRQNRPIRMSVTKSATTYPRFYGYTALLEPTFPTDNSSTGVVAVTAVDGMALMTRRTAKSLWVEEAVRLAKFSNTPGTWVDCYSFNSAKAAGPQYFQNLGVTGYDNGGFATTGLGTCDVEVPSRGSYSLSNADSLIGDGAIDFTPNEQYAIGPVLRVLPQKSQFSAVIKRVDFWLKVPSSTTVAVAGQPLVVAQFWDRAAWPSGLQFSFRLFNSGSGTQLAVYSDPNPATLSFVVQDADGPIVNINDDQWRKLSVFYNTGTLSTAFATNDFVYNSSSGWNILIIDLIYFGGAAFPNQRRSPRVCPTVSIAGLTVYGEEVVNTSVPYQYLSPTASFSDCVSWFSNLCEYADTAIATQRHVYGVSYSNVSTTVTSTNPAFTSADVGAGFGVNDMNIQVGTTITAWLSPTQVTISQIPMTNASNRVILVGPKLSGTDMRFVSRIDPADSGNLGEALRTLGRSIGGLVYFDTSGYPVLVHADQMRSITPLFSVDVENDLEAAGLELRQGIDAVPTRVTVSGPIGDVLFVNAAAEASSDRKDVSVTAGARYSSDAYAIGGYYANRGRGLRIAAATVDLVTAGADLYSTFLTVGNLRTGVRVRATNIPSAVFGATQADSIVQGWRETWDATSAVFEFDLTPADDPVEGTLDNAEFGRWASDQSLVLAYPITSGATTIRTAAYDGTSPAFTTSAGDYPLDIDIQGERVTASSAPTTLARTNLVTNPGFTTNATGWTGFASATIARSTVVGSMFNGTTAGLITWPTITAFNSAVGYAVAVTSGQTYTFSLYVYTPSGSPRVQIGELAGSGSSVSFTRQDTTGFTDTWVRLGVTLTATATTTYTFVIRNVDAAVSGMVTFIDAALLENTALGLGSYFDGGTNGGAWTGTAGASTSTQTAQVFTVTRGVSPTPARAHSTAEIVDAYHSMAWTF